MGAADALYCAVRGGRLSARITTAAYQVIAERIEEDAGRFLLIAAGRAWPIGPGSGHDWPGNVREPRSAIEHGVICRRDTRI